MSFRQPLMGAGIVFGCLLAGVVAGTANALPPLSLQTYVSGFSRPLAFVQHPTDPTIQFVVQQYGLIKIVENGSVRTPEFLDLRSVASTSGSERGVLGLAFPPDYETTRRFYVNYTSRSTGATQVVRYLRDANNRYIADPNPDTILMTVSQPFSNHNGGGINFGPDGYLYIGMGDGGSGGDPINHGQRPTSLLGKMLRINVEGEGAYTIPIDNPFVDDDPIDALDEIWAFGVRNPWRWTFDSLTGAMVMADVGQDRYEEVNYEPAGAGGRNYGWRRREGAHNFNLSLPPAYEPLTEPILEYFHNVGFSITGGYVYRGTELGPEFCGRYFFADYVTRRLWSVQIIVDEETGEVEATGLVEHTAEVGGTGQVGAVSSFGVDASGEVYIVNFSGQVRRIVTNATIAQPTSVTRVRGIPGSGDVSDLLCNDNSRYVTKPDIFQPAPLDNPSVQVEIIGTSSITNPTEIRFVLQSQANINDSIRQNIMLFDYIANDYVRLDQRVISTTDQNVEVIVVANPSRFVKQNNGEVKALIQHVGLLLSLPQRWTAGIDLASWSIN